jgi:hypothetical protein
LKPDVLSPALDLEQAFSSVQGKIDRERGPIAALRSMATPLRFGLAALAVVLAVVFAVALTGGWHLLLEAGRLDRLVVLIGYLGLLAAGIGAALRPMHRPENIGKSRALVGVGILLPFVAALYPLHESHEVPGEAGYCVILGVVLAGALVGLFKVLDRGAHENRRSALLGVVTAAMATNVALEFHCPITRADHKLLFHASVGVVIALAYLLVARRVRGLPNRSATA